MLIGEVPMTLVTDVGVVPDLIMLMGGVPLTPDGEMLIPTDWALIGILLLIPVTDVGVVPDRIMLMGGVLLTADPKELVLDD